MSAILSPGVPYGLKAVRQIKATNTSSRGVKQSARLQKRKERTLLFFLEKVDPILGDCITHMLVEQPADVPNAMINFFKIWSAKAAAQTPDRDLLEPEQWPAVRPKKELRVFLATSIGPVVAKLVNRVAVSLPDNVVDFMISELESMLTEDALIPDRAPIPEPSVAVEAGPEVSSTVQVSIAQPAAPMARTLNIPVFGVGGAGKTTLINILQGRYEPTKPTVGFRPVTMSLSDSTTVKLYDLGGGAKIRDIWRQYYHDAHGVIYVIDSSLGEEQLAEGLQVLEDTLADACLRGKPLLVFANKQDKAGARPAAYWQDVLAIPDDYEDSLFIAECSAFVPAATDPAAEGWRPDANIESAVDMLLQAVLERYPVLDERVQRDTKAKAAEEVKHALQKQRNVLRSKIASAFLPSLSPALIDSMQVTADPANIFTLEEGEAFLAAEIGEEVLPALAVQVAAMVGYQRLAMQIIGALKVPISKKKVPMSWDDIYALVADVRKELGL